MREWKWHNLNCIFKIKVLIPNKSTKCILRKLEIQNAMIICWCLPRPWEGDPKCRTLYCWHYTRGENRLLKLGIIPFTSILFKFILKILDIGTKKDKVFIVSLSADDKILHLEIQKNEWRKTIRTKYFEIGLMQNKPTTFSSFYIHHLENTMSQNIPSH